MNLQDAINSGKHFREPGGEWLEVRGGMICWVDKEAESDDPYMLCLVSKILATNWEIKEPMVTLTRTSFWNAVHAVMSANDRMPYEWTHQLGNLARKLGLEE